MSVHFNPKHPSTNPQQPNPVPKRSFWERVAREIYKAEKMEQMNSFDYCEWLWDIRDPDVHGKTYESWMKGCQKAYDIHKRNSEYFKKY